MVIRGAVHVHSTLSRDGTMTIPELARYFKRKGYCFVAMGEHAEDLNEAKLQALRHQGRENSGDDFCLIPGVEFAVTKQIHIVGIGITELLELDSPVRVAERIREHNGFSILAHPKRAGWDCPPDVVRALDAVEIWNIGYDGKYLPSAKALPAFALMHEINPQLGAMASHDFHRQASFYNVAVEMNVNAVSVDPILQNLKQGSYALRSPFFSCASDGHVSPAGAVLVRHVSATLETLRRARSGFTRRTV